MRVRRSVSEWFYVPRNSKTNKRKYTKNKQTQNKQTDPRYNTEHEKKTNTLMET